MTSAGLLVMRVALGLLFVGHGTQKLFGWFGGGGIGGTARMFDSVGFRPGRVTAPLGGLAEAGGGALLVLGLFTPIGSLAVIVMMIGAIAAVHAPRGWWNTAGGMEFPAFLATIAFALVLTGPGRYSVDHALGLRLAGAAWAVGVGIVAALAAIVIVALLTRPHEGATTP
jgi:putative oxidoreductase